MLRADTGLPCSYRESSGHRTARLAIQSARPALTFDPLPIIVQSSWRRAADRLSPLALGSAGPRPRCPKGGGLYTDWPASAARLLPRRRPEAIAAGPRSNISGGHLPRIAKYLSSNYSITGLLVRSSSHNSAIFAPAPAISHSQAGPGRAGRGGWPGYLCRPHTHTHTHTNGQYDGQWSVVSY